jgi:hypothetical protein
MGSKLPTDFNAEGYAAAYPDVGLSGLSPKEHYLRFGRLLGRAASGKSARAKTPTTPAKPPSESKPSPAPGEPSELVEPAPARRPPPEEAIFARPPDFNAAEVKPSSAAPKNPEHPSSAISLAELMPVAQSDEDLAILSGPLVSYARMTGIENPGREGEALVLCDPRLKSGVARLDNAWFADPSTIRLMIAGARERISEIAGWMLRAYQATPANPGKLQAAGGGIRFPEKGPCFVDIELIHPLMPVLLELADGGGQTRALALLPFPSLLPGGLHWAESKALQVSADAMDSIWALSEALLRELIGGVTWRKRQIARLTIAPGPKPEGSGMLSADVRDWLDAIFGIDVGEGGAGGRAAGRRKGASGLAMALPVNAVPTIAALVSRGPLDFEAGPYLVADAEGRPRWSIALPPCVEPTSGLPRLQNLDSSKRRSTAGQAPIHLAILYRSTGSSEPQPLSAEAQNREKDIPRASVLLHASEPARTEAAVRSLQDLLGNGFELLVRVSDGSDIRDLDRLIGPGGWRAVDPSLSLRDVAREARHDLLLTMDEDVSLTPGLLPRLWEILNGADDVASTSCLLLGETVLKKQVVLRPGAGGLFPAGVSFARGPAMAFNEPDVSGALEGLTYPVVANRLALAMWRKAALADLPCAAGRVPRQFEDISFGLELLRAGYRNLCTTTVQARISGVNDRRDTIDPVGTAYLQPGAWEDLLGRVTILRELF